jgi:two-component system cell cycle sensor histidine kinase/response regulator CckA
MDLHPHVLLVEDEEPVRTVATRSLERLGCTVHACATGDEAIAFAAAHLHEVDLLVADVVMPGIGGREVVWRLREMRPGLPVVLASGVADEIAADDLGDGATAFLPKPFSLQELESAVRAVLAPGP